MTRAEEAALKAYPEKTRMITCEEESIIVHDGEYERSVFVEGYEQAEKDLALTWEDIKEIQRLLDMVWSEQDITALINENTIYTEVLKRFKEENKL